MAGTTITVIGCGGLGGFIIEGLARSGVGTLRLVDFDTFDVSNLSAHEMDIAFFTKHQYIKIYGDNELIYEYTDNGGIWGHTNGVAWNFLHIPYGTSRLSIYLTAAYDNVKSDVPTFLIGDKLNIFQI